MKKLLLLLFIAALSSSCVLLPYRDKPLCTRGTGEGLCGSLSDVYTEVNKNIDNYCGSCQR